MTKLAVLKKIFRLAKVINFNDTTICEGKNYTLTAPNATAYSWSTGSNTNSISVTQTGDYSVEITAAKRVRARAREMSLTERFSECQ